MANKRFIHCPYCGGKLIRTIIDQRHREHCPQCDHVVYMNPLPVVSCLLFDDKGRILLVLRKNEPYQGMWCLPMGFAEVDEHIEDAALRELEEETGVKGRIVRLLDAESTDDSHYGHLLILAYVAERVGGEVQAGDDAANAAFFPLDQLPPLAFAANETAINKYTSLRGSKLV
ncbi:MAG: NUDIX hydrolase [Sedimentisphaerales bacterium]|nr:NUDIX hydrolase [Sedimentisphaerales bacterium]